MVLYASISPVVVQEITCLSTPASVTLSTLHGRTSGVERPWISHTGLFVKLAAENETSPDVGNFSSTTVPRGIKVSGYNISFKVVPDSETTVGSEDTEHA